MAKLIKYTQSDIDYIKANYKTKTVSEMAAHLGRSTYNLRMKMFRLGFIETDGGWSAGEDHFLLSSHRHMSIARMSETLELGELSVKRRMNVLGIDMSEANAPSCKQPDGQQSWAVFL